MSTEQAKEAAVQVETPAPETEGAGDSPDCDLMHTVADGLTGHGLDVHDPERGVFHYLRITNRPGTLCDVVICEDGSAEWEYRLSRGRYTDPAIITDIALRILGAKPHSPALPEADTDERRWPGPGQPWNAGLLGGIQGRLLFRGVFGTRSD
jgi:hypothetical protein